ncbi:MAG: hypothetical protein U0821_04830 [Chloroflexota bacterium]
MELRAYGAVIRRHWRLVLGLIVLSFLASVFFALRGPSAYTASMRLAISVIPDPQQGNFFRYDSYYAVLTSEYLADDLSEVIKSEAFALDVSEELGYALEPAAISNLTRTKKTHRLLDVTVVGGDRQQVLAICEAIERVLNKKLDQYFAFLKVNNGFVRIVNRPEVKRTSSLVLMTADIGLRTFAAACVGLGLAFLLEYLDDRLRDRRQAESFLGARVLGEIPAR